MMPAFLRAPVERRRLGTDERGLTLMELTIVGMLATLVMLALTGFYFNSQNMWIEGSTQALAQRDATLLVEGLRDRVHEANAATVTPAGPGLDVLVLGKTNGDQIQFQRNPDGLLHQWVNGSDVGAMADTPVTGFQITTVGVDLVDLTLLELRTADGDTIRIASQFALLGK